MTIEHKALHEWASWRDEWTGEDVEKALAYVGLKDWTYDHWSDGDMQFLHKGPVAFDDLAKLRIAFTPRGMVVEAVVDDVALEEQNNERAKTGLPPLPSDYVPCRVLVSMSWNA